MVAITDLERGKLYHVELTRKLASGQPVTYTGRFRGPTIMDDGANAILLGVEGHSIRIEASLITNAEAAVDEVADVPDEALA